MSDLKNSILSFDFLFPPLACCKPLQDPRHEENNNISPPQTNGRKSKRGRLIFYKRMRQFSKRIPSNDIRKTFPIMYCNVVNQLDYALLDSLLCRYMTPNCEIVRGAVPQLDVPMHCYRGSSQCAKNIYELLSPFPDFIFILESSRIIRSLNEDHSIIEVLNCINATKVIYPSSLPTPDASPPLPQTMKIMFKLRELFYMDDRGSIVRKVVTTMF